MKKILHHRSDIRALGFVALQLVLLVLSWLGIWRSPMVIAATAGLAFICGIVIHNQIHCPVFKRRSFNRWFQCALTLGFGRGPTSVLTSHIERHHGHLETELDFVRTNQVNSSANWWNLLRFPFVVIANMRRERSSDLMRWRSQNPKLFRQAVLERVVLFSVLTVALLMKPLASFLCLVLPWVIGQLGMIAINLLQHQDCDSDSPFDHSRNVTGKLVNWMFLNNGFHTAHHLRPTLHWSCLRDYHRKEVEPNMNSALNYRSLLHLIWMRVIRTRELKSSS